MSASKTTSETNLSVSNNDEKSFFILGCFNRRLIEKMVAKEEDINMTDDKGKTILHHAVEKDVGFIVREILKGNPDVTIVDENKQTAFHIAVEKEYFPIMKQFIDYGVDVDFPKIIEPPIFWSVVNGKDNLTELLITAGADVNKAREIDGSTPLFAAIIGDHTGRSFELLIAAGANIHVQNKRGVTLLHFASLLGKKNFVEMLIALKADINAFSEAEGTPLHCAVFAESTEVINLLLMAGADHAIANKEGRNPSQEAEYNGSHWISKMIDRLVLILDLQKDMESRSQNIQKYLEFFKQTKSFERKIKRYKLLH